MIKLRSSFLTTSLSVVAFSTMLISSSSLADAEAVRKSGQGITLEADPDLPTGKLDDLVADIETTKRRVVAYLQNADIYKSKYKDHRIAFVVSNEFRFPYQEGNKIYLPRPRVENLFNDDCEKKNCSLAIAHELTHVFAISANRENKDIKYGGRFFDDGLAVFLQHKLGLRPSYPNFGRGLHTLVANLAEKHNLIPLENAEHVRNTNQGNELRLLAYLQEGSFTEFLIENFGLNQYLRIYFGEKPQEVVGYDMASLEQKWRTFILAL